MSSPLLRIIFIKDGFRAAYSSLEKSIKYIDLNGLLPTFNEPIDSVDLDDPRPVIDQMQKTINSLKP